MGRSVVPLCPVRTRPQDSFCLRPFAGGKRPAPGAQSAAASSDSDAKKAKVLPSYILTAAMKVSDQQPLPWELAIYCVLLLLQVDSQSGKRRRADASEQGATDELEAVVFSESVLLRAPGLGGLGSRAGPASLGSSAACRLAAPKRIDRAARPGGAAASWPGATSGAGAGRADGRLPRPGLLDPVEPSVGSIARA